jgi:hypothetical protein
MRGSAWLQYNTFHIDLLKEISTINPSRSLFFKYQLWDGRKPTVRARWNQKLCISAASYRILTCTRALRAQFIITAASTLERKERTTATPEFSDEWLSNCIALIILPVHNDVLEYLN